MKKPLSSLFPYALLAGCIAATMLLLSYITLYSDDYYYSTFFYGGLGDFWERTVDHYLTFNGRAFIHFVAQVFLVFRTHLYAVVFPFLMALAFALAHRVQCPDGAKFSPAATAVSLGILLALPVVYLNQTLCWIAGSFNYCFPALVIFAYLFFQQRALRADAAWHTLVFASLIGFLAGATTEQNGIAALAVGFLTILCALVRAERKSRPWKGALPLAFTLAGYATVLFAPGTANRIAVEGGDAGSLSVLLNPALLIARFKDIMRYFCGADMAQPSAVLLITALMLLLACLPLISRKKLHRPLLAGFPAAAVYILALLTEHAATAAFTVCLYLAFAGILLLFDPAWETSGVLLIGSLAAIGIMIFTALGAFRTVVPTLLFLIAVTVRLAEALLAHAADRLGKYGKAVLPTAAALTLAACAVISLPTFIGYRQNHAVHLKNEAAIADGIESGEIILSSDVTDLHRHTLMYEGGYFFTQFRASYKIPADTVIHIEGEHYAHFPTTVGDKTLRQHAMMTQSVLYLPMVQIMEAFGGTCVWDFDTGNGYYLTLNGTSYYLSKTDWCIRDTATGEVVTAEAYTTALADMDYIEVHAFAAFVGVPYEFDWKTVMFDTGA